MTRANGYEQAYPEGHLLLEARPSRNSWLRALNFSERLVLSGGLPFDPCMSEERRKRASVKIPWWLEHLTRASSLAQRREVEFNLSADFALDLIGASTQDLAETSGPLPSWVYELEHVLDSCQDQLCSESSGTAGKDGTQFLISPWLRSASRRFENWVEKSGIASSLRLEAGQLTKLLLPALAERLRLIVERTFVLEFNVTRARGGLRGKTIEDQVAEFGAGFKQPSREFALLEEYPVLARILTEEAIQWHRCASELSARLSSDWETIQSAFFGGQRLNKLTNIRVGVGDRHRGGRTVSFIQFDNDKSVVYKPRPLRIESVFKELLAFLDEHSEGLPLFFPNVLDRGQYGWSEFVRYAPCPDEADLARFYQRAGKLLGIMFILGATDLHYGNIIARGEHPVPVDLECLCQPCRPRFSSATALDRVRSNTALGPGLLPERPLGGVDGLNQSGFSELREGTLLPYTVLRRNISDADGLRLVREQVAVPRGAATNLPTHEVGNGKGPLHFLPSLLMGFRECLATLIRCREELVASSLWHSLFELRYRYLVRTTPDYWRILMNSYHPNVLRDAMDRETIFDELWRETSVPKEATKSMVASEREDLWRGDIPLFSFSALDTNLIWNSREREVWRGEGLRVNNGVEERLLTLDNDIVERNAWVIQTAYEAAHTQPSALASRALSTERFSATPVGTGSDVSVRLAKQIADYILDLGFPDNGRLCWIDTLQISDESKVRYYAGVVNEDLYSGLSGFLLFFHYAARVLKEARFERAAEAITDTLLESLKHVLPNASDSIGGFSGHSSILYALTHRLGISKSVEIVKGCDGLLDLIERLMSQDETFDVIGGSAGAICLLLSHLSVTNDPRCLALAEKCGGRLLDRAIRQQSGFRWKTFGDVPCCGFAHGTSGIAYSLFRLAATTKKEKYLLAACQATRYRQSFYSAELKNWLDLRPGTRTNDTVAWCQGAPGIGLALAAQILLGFGDVDCYRDLELAFEKTISTKGDKHNLCHGAFGNLDCLISMATATANAHWRGRVDLLAIKLIDEVVEKGVTCDSYSETLNLMLGLAGIGYALLRVADSEHVPSTLLLESPHG